MTNAKKFASILVPAAYLTTAVSAWAADPADASGVQPPVAVATPAPEANSPAAPVAAPPSNGTAPAAASAPNPAPINLAASPTSSNPSAPSTSEPPQKEEPATVFNSKSALGGFGGIDVSYSRFAGKDVALLCLEGGLLIDHTFSIGAAGCGIAPDRPTNQINPAADPSHRTEFGYGGALLRYRVFSHKYLNLSIGSLIGAGAIVSDNFDDDEYHNHRSHNPDMVFVFDPQVSANVNLTKWMRLGVTGGYHFVAGIDTKGLSRSDVAAPSIGGQLLFGEF